MGPDRGILASMLSLLAALAVPATVAAAPQPHTPKPDLKITKLVTGGLGVPPFTVVGTDGVAQRFAIDVTTKNQGDGTAPPTTTIVKITDGKGNVYEHKIAIRRLGPHKRVDRMLEITDLKPQLGIARIEATADADNTAKESDETNNHHPGERFAVIARQWNVQQWTTLITAPLNGKNTTDSGSGFRFRFSHYDEQDDAFIYSAAGPVTNDQSQSGVCPYHGMKTVTQNPWGKTYLRIERDLKHYDAFLDPSSAPQYPITVTCLGGFSYTMKASFEALVTYAGGGEASMGTSQSELSDDTHSTALRTRWIWDFLAAIPSRQ